jgi:TolB-like protein/DNA-binding winged helix-turn-helix (wHTH) protein/Tfp pilus assembly protein PilF
MMLREQRVSAESLTDCPGVSRSERGHRRLSLEQPEQAALRLTYSFGPFLLDPAERRLVRDGRNLRLPPKVFETLVLLVERHGLLVEKDDLMTAIWPGTFVEEVTLSRNISLLRKALGDTPGQDQSQYIETVSKSGYRFIADVREVYQPATQSSGPQEVESESVVLRIPRRWWQNRRAWISLLGLVLLLTGIGAFWRFKAHSHPVVQIRSLAVLPLENLSGDPDQEYFADGMTDALITDLAKLHSIRVISRTSVMQYKRTRKLLPQIVRELGVDAVVEGAVVRSGQNIRITAQLIDAATDRHLWADSYERDSHDILRLQNEVALAIAEQVQGKLDPEHRVRFSAASVNPEAYDNYVKGRYFWDKYTLDSVNKSLDFFNRAIQIDPSFAPAYVGIAEAHINLMFAYNVVSPASGCDKAEREPQKALEIDNALAEAHAALARFKMQCEWDWAGAEREFRQAIDLAPGSSEVHHQYAHYLVAMGRIAEAWSEGTRSLELAPYGIRANSHQGWHHFYAREYDLAIRDFQRTLTMQPNDSYSLRFLASSYEQRHLYSEAIAELQKAAPDSASSPVMRAALGYANAVAGNRREALTMASELEREAKHQYVSAHDIALIYLGLGDKAQAINWLEKAYQERSSNLIYLQVDPRFDGLRTDPRFQDLLRRMGLNT